LCADPEEGGCQTANVKQVSHGSTEAKKNYEMQIEHKKESQTSCAGAEGLHVSLRTGF
jgi:hypothetical protein